MRRFFLLFALAFFAFHTNARSHEPDVIKVDVLVYGGTAAGVVAAVTVKQLGKSVLLVEPGNHLGGMSSGGLGQTDFGNKAAIGGLSLQFYTRVGKAMGEPGPAWAFPPGVAEKVFRDWVAEYGVDVWFAHRVATAWPNDDRRALESAILVKTPPLPNGAPGLWPAEPEYKRVDAKVFIDCSYEGDLAAESTPITYSWGRESAGEFAEPLNGIRAETPKHQFPFPVDPYVKPGDPASGLIALVQPGDGGKPGGGDVKIQAYNFRLCLTKNPANRLPIGPPPGYDPARFELLARHVEALVKNGKGKTLGELMHIQMVTPDKTDINNNGPVSTDFIGENYDYPEGAQAAGDHDVRTRIWTAHLHYTQGFLHFLATSDRVPKHLRDDMSQWGLCKDEFTDTGGWPHQLYVREARHLVGRYVVTQADCEHRAPPVDDSIGVGAYAMDSHNVQRIVQNGVVRNEGDVQVKPVGPYPIPYRAITPGDGECTNVLVPVCLSASHIAYGSIRMEPVFMVLGESAAVAARTAIDEKTSVQDVDVVRLKETLLKRGQILEWKKE